MSLRRHIETTVRPWLSIHARQVFSNRRLLLGTDDDTESWDLIEILEELLRGSWEPPTSPWESRKDAMLDLLAKATPFNFTPMLQIDGTSRTPGCRCPKRPMELSQRTYRQAKYFLRCRRCVEPGDFTDRAGNRQPPPRAANGEYEIRR